MGVAATHYIVIGVALTDKVQINEFFSLTEKHFEFFDNYNDNAYKDQITPTPSGVHIIADGMSGKYVVVGKIIYKSLNGFKLMQIPTREDYSVVGAGAILNDFPGIESIVDQYRQIYPEIKNLDQELDTKFGAMDAKVLVFTHWH